MTDDPRLTPADSDLRDRYADALRGAFLNRLTDDSTTNTAVTSFESLADVVLAVRDAEVERLRGELAAERAETMRAAELIVQYTQKGIENGQRAEQAKAERDALKATNERVERLRDIWLTYPHDDMHHAAGLMLARHLSGEAFTTTEEATDAQ